MIRPLVTSFALPIIVATAWFVCAQPPAQRGQAPAVREQPAQADGLKPIMQRKLDHSKAILEGLALEDYEAIAKNAQALSLLSLESTWNVVSTQEYLQHSQDFRRAIKQIIEAAHEKNVDQATLGYVDLTMRCVACHKYLRETRSK
jgi:hypothetical protein